MFAAQRLIGMKELFAKPCLVLVFLLSLSASLMLMFWCLESKCCCGNRRSYPFGSQRFYDLQKVRQGHFPTQLAKLLSTAWSMKDGSDIVCACCVQITYYIFDHSLMNQSSMHPCMKLGLNKEPPERTKELTRQSVREPQSTELCDLDRDLDWTKLRSPTLRSA